MTKQTLTRSMVRSTIHGFVANFANGVPSVESLDPIVVYGKVTEKEAKKMLISYAGVSNVMVGEIISEPVVMEISLNDFLAHAHEVKPEPEQDSPGIEQE